MAALMVFVVFLVSIALSVPIGVAMIVGSVAPIFTLGKGGSIAQIINNTFSGANSTPILAVPLFILGGVIMAEGGISRRLFNFFAYFVGRFPGGVPCAVILTCLFYGAISGSGPATTAAVGSMCIPFMVSLGYNKRWSAGLISVAGGLGVIIPPSIPFVLYSLATGVSTGNLFLGGIPLGGDFSQQGGNLFQLSRKLVLLLCGSSQGFQLLQQRLILISQLVNLVCVFGIGVFDVADDILSVKAVESAAEILDSCHNSLL